MGDLINLRLKRKGKARDDKDKTSKENRARFGQTKIEKKKSATEKEKVKKRLDGAKLGGDDGK